MRTHYVQTMVLSVVAATFTMTPSVAAKESYRSPDSILASQGSAVERSTLSGQTRDALLASQGHVHPAVDPSHTVDRPRTSLPSPDVALQDSGPAVDPSPSYSARSGTDGFAWTEAGLGLVTGLILASSAAVAGRRLTGHPAT
jgi:hypothetical protein